MARNVFCLTPRGLTSSSIFVYRLTQSQIQRSFSSTGPATNFSNDVIRLTASEATSSFQVFPRDRSDVDAFVKLETWLHRSIQRGTEAGSKMRENAESWKSAYSQRARTRLIALTGDGDRSKDFFPLFRWVSILATSSYRVSWKWNVSTRSLLLSVFIWKRNNRYKIWKLEYVSHFARYSRIS